VHKLTLKFQEKITKILQISLQKAIISNRALSHCCASNGLLADIYQTLYIAVLKNGWKRPRYLFLFFSL